MWFRFTTREWAALGALTAVLAFGVVATWPDGSAVIRLSRATRQQTPGWPQTAGRVDINRASAEELTALPGIGMVKAARIVAYREEHGRFWSVEELTGVRGIGPATLEGLRVYAVAGSEDTR